MDRINFGIKHRGKLISDVIKIDPDYIKWAVKKKLLILPKYLKL